MQDGTAAGYHDEDVEVWDSHGKLVAQSRQLAKLTAPAAGTTVRMRG